MRYIINTKGNDMKTIITHSQYDALMLISEDDRRVPARELNIRPQTWNALVARGWVSVSGGYASVTDKAWSDIS